MNEDLHLEITPEIAQGKYTNFALISHTPHEFILDFVFTVPSQPALVVSRLMTSPQHAKAVLQALAENIQRYEAEFGVIEQKGVRISGSSTRTN